MVLTTFACLPIFWSKGKITRIEGFILINFYIFYILDKILFLNGFNYLSELRIGLFIYFSVLIVSLFAQEKLKFSDKKPYPGWSASELVISIADNIAACIVEPIAGSTGTLVPPVGYLQRLRELCDKHNILLIFDEVITGWGRTGSTFGAQEFGVTPDIMTMAKATTNGIVPFGVVACKEEIYDAVIDNSPKGAIELFHGYTYSGIPVSVAAALAVQDIFEKEDIFNRAKELAPYFQEGLFSLKDIDVVDNIRGYGMMGGIDIKTDGRPGKAGLATFKHCYDAGVNFKATGDCLIIAPMFICEKKHIDEIIEKLRTGITNYAKSKKN